MDLIPLPAYSELTYLPSAPPYSEAGDAPSTSGSGRGHTLAQDGNVFANDDFTFDYDLFHVRLNRSRWRLSAPAYGFNGTVEGVVRLEPRMTHAVKIIATLKGKIKISAMERGVTTGAIIACILSKEAVLWSLSTHSGSPYGRDLAFSIPIPTYINGGTSPLPPTARLLHPGVSCEIAYSLNVRVSRKGFRFHKTLKIPIVYLPKSRPSFRPLSEIPSPSYSSDVMDRIVRFNVSPSWPCRHASVPEELLPSVMITLPSPLCYTAGEGIPILLTLTCRHAPMHNKLLVPNIHIQLIRQTEVWLKGGSNRLSGLGEYASLRETSRAKASLCHLDEGEDGVSQLYYRLKAGKCGGESSWAVSKVVNSSYYIQVNIKPPEVASNYLPSYRRNIVVQLMTDHWGTQDTEMLAMDGLPVPALGLAREAREILLI
ncbi:hypothetical protein NEOLEDRAFT_1240965 [Neolentinus lepideus HHB14362 ss-1]|uniref:Arrestin-like N-terminal domain-containing protein n=1 Tax=Neolentinus lepideus HHB14362 ss-1 TaxID=1314782 RepID=A0A165TDC2_9AGAM|nr:hypothetical protein NEOLEDRAFT_1240965 [Neolentinus lepideus HHB14362 ss-1]